MRRVASTDGVTLAVHDLGGEGPPLVMVHATGFCGAVFRPLARALSGSFHSWAVDVRGHGGSTPPDLLDFRWSGFADDVLAAVAEVAPKGTYALGHSSGGAAVLDAEARSPGTFRALYCYEPIVWPSPPPAGSRDFLIQGALRRRATFASHDEATANFAAKRPFSSFAPEALEAYVDCGFEVGASGELLLRCRPEWEAEVYRQGLAHDGATRLSAVTCPVTIASGDQWEAVSAEALAAQVNSMPNARSETLVGLGHLGPMEDAEAVARSVLLALAP